MPTSEARRSAQSVAAYRDLYRESADRYTESRLGWLEGKIALGLGRMEEAEKSLSHVRGTAELIGKVAGHLRRARRALAR